MSSSEVRAVLGQWLAGQLDQLVFDSIMKSTEKMGCDIHMVLERKIDGAWVGAHTYFGMDGIAIDRFVREGEKRPIYTGWTVTSRNYKLFSQLAGVRAEHGLVEEIPEPRGIPDDISPLANAEIESWGADGHSHSWGLLSEIGGFFLAHYHPKKVLDEDRQRAVHSMFNTGMDEETPLENYRLIYWFDN